MVNTDLLNLILNYLRCKNGHLDKIYKCSQRYKHDCDGYVCLDCKHGELENNKWACSSGCEYLDRCYCRIITDSTDVCLACEDLFCYKCSEEGTICENCDNFICKYCSDDYIDRCDKCVRKVCNVHCYGDWGFSCKVCHGNICDDCAYDGENYLCEKCHENICSWCKKIFPEYNECDDEINTTILCKLCSKE